MMKQDLMEQLKPYAEMYKNELLNQVIPFWEQHSIDEECGGFYTCLDEKGKVYDTDKFMWLQGRQVWTFAMLYNQVAKKQKWLDIALKGAEFMLANGRDSMGRWYFSLTKEGQPLVDPYNIFSDCFAAMAFGELYKATHDQKHKMMAYETYQSILERSTNSKGKWNKAHPGTRNIRNFALPMILCNLSLILEDVLGKQMVDEMVHPLITDILTNFLDREKGIILENIADHRKVDCFETRIINPGHGNQSIWFLLDLAVRYQNKTLISQLQQLLITNTQFGWDKKHGGIFYFLDKEGHPPQQLQWDQKLWWVHIETMISFLKAYKLTGNPVCKEWFEKIHKYTWEHFRDQQNKGQWFGYLNRQGEVLLRLKGGKWKGCFHVPRGLFQLWKTISNCQDKK